MSRILEQFVKSGLNCQASPRVGQQIEELSDIETAGLDDQLTENEEFSHAILSSKSKSVLPEYPNDQPSLFRFFIDGSRRVYPLTDIVVKNKCYPILVGQVGVAVIERNELGKVSPVLKHCKNENYIVFPNTLASEDYPEYENIVNESSRFKFKIIKYNASNIEKKSESNARSYADLGVAKIITEMHKFEKNAIGDLSDSGMVLDDRMLIIDGAIQFGDLSFDLEQYRNVIGVSKSFQSHLSLGKGKRDIDVGTLTRRLDFGERTVVAEIPYGKHKLGTWYLKIRRKKYMHAPSQGVVKVETFAVDEDEIENGFNEARIDNISKCLLSERNVTPYGKDKRWAVHLYPIFQAEQYIKSHFIGKEALLGVF